jgi:NitT/TauT family transport system permease protein
VRVSRIIAPVATLLVALACWEVAVRVLNPPPFLVPAPSAVAEAAYDDAPMLAAATVRTALGSAGGFAVAGALGLALGSAIAAVGFLRRGIYPLATIFQMVPLVAVAPLMVIWFGYGVKTTIAASAVVAFFPVLAATIDGFSSVDPGLRELFAMHGSRGLSRWLKLDLPASLPSIATGLRIAAGLAVIGAVVGEFVSGYGGRDAPLGIVILTSMREARTDLVFAAVALAAIVGFALFGIVNVASWLLLRRWHASAR